MNTTPPPAATATLRLAPTAFAVREIGPWLREALRDVDPAQAAALLSRMELAVHEVCMNVVDHAGLPPGGVIELRLVLGPDDLTVRVRDAGAEFTPPTASPSGPEPRERGYGLTIVRTLVDDLRYRRTGSGNEMTLRVRTGGDRGA